VEAKVNTIASLKRLIPSTRGSWSLEAQGVGMMNTKVNYNRLMLPIEWTRRCHIDSAYIFIGGLPYGLTEGDLITIFSQSVYSAIICILPVLKASNRYGEIMDVNMPRDKDTGKTRGFGFVMYEDQRSTVLAVDNLNGGKILDRTIRVDHVKNYKQAKVKGEDGEYREREEQSLNAKPELIQGVYVFRIFVFLFSHQMHGFPLDHVSEDGEINI
jgi:RNA-binding motif protein, X-linked 2